MKKTFTRILLLAGLILTVFTACQKDDGSSVNNHLRYHFASQTEGRQLKMANTVYFEGLNQYDLDWKTWHSGATIAEYKALAEAQIVDFTEDEMKALSKVMDFIESRCVELGIQFLSMTRLSSSRATWRTKAMLAATPTRTRSTLVRS